MILVCWWLTLRYSLRSFNVRTPNGSVMVDGHEYAEAVHRIEDGIELNTARCLRCGHVDEGVGRRTSV